MNQIITYTQLSQTHTTNYIAVMNIILQHGNKSNCRCVKMYRNLRKSPIAVFNL